VTCPRAVTVNVAMVSYESLERQAQE
jgi:hypothetical protein